MKPFFQVAAFAIVVVVAAQHADAQCCGQPVATYYAPAPTVTYYAPTTSWYPTTAYYGGGSNSSGYYGGGYYGRGNYGGGYYGRRNYGGGAFGTGVGGWRGARGMGRRIDRRN